ncbi:MAG: DUF975 family protein [Lachnospiraceae bacterium]
MWERKDLKMRGKAAFKSNYLAAVIVALVVIISTGGTGAGAGAASQQNQTNDEQSYTQDVESDSPVSDIVVLLTSAAAFGVLAIVFLLKIVIGNLLIVGGRRFFVENREHKAEMNLLFWGFKSGQYVNIALTMFLRDLFIGLWTILFIVPGIYKYYEYYMVSFLLCENPGMDRKEAFRTSKQMMQGHKMNTFVLELSFILWQGFSGITCGIAGVFYVNPYIQSTEAELYAVLKTNNAGTCS